MVRGAAAAMLRSLRRDGRSHQYPATSISAARPQGIAAWASLRHARLDPRPPAQRSHAEGPAWAALLGEAVAPEVVQALDAQDGGDASPPVAQAGWFAKLQAIGKPLVLGLALFGVAGGLITWALVHLFWTLGVQAKRRRRLRHGARALTGGQGLGAPRPKDSTCRMLL